MCYGHTWHILTEIYEIFTQKLVQIYLNIEKIRLMMLIQMLGLHSYIKER